MIILRFHTCQTLRPLGACHHNTRQVPKGAEGTAAVLGDRIGARGRRQGLAGLRDRSLRAAGSRRAISGRACCHAPTRRSKKIVKIKLRRTRREGPSRGRTPLGEGPLSGEGPSRGRDPQKRKPKSFKRASASSAPVHRMPLTPNSSAARTLSRRSSMNATSVTGTPRRCKTSR